MDGLYAGLRVEAEAFGMEIVGGNISAREHGVFIDIFLFGEATQKNVVLRSGAHVGDKILVTGTLGDAAAGVELMLASRSGAPRLPARTRRSPASRYHADAARARRAE